MYHDCDTNSFPDYYINTGDASTPVFDSTPTSISSAPSETAAQCAPGVADMDNDGGSATTDARSPHSRRNLPYPPTSRQGTSI